MTKRKKCLRLAAWGFWLLCFAIIMVDVARKPDLRTTTPTYRFASTQWWKGIDPYTYDNPAASPAAPDPAAPWMTHHDDFLYFPQAAVLFTPFNVLPFFVGEFLWRACTFGLFAYALCRLHRTFLVSDKTDPDKLFLLLSLLAVPSSLASLRNAQFDLPLAALIILATAEIAAGRLTAAALWLCLALALKPLALVPILLFDALYWRLLPRLAIGLLIVAAIPFLHWNPAFVAHEYVRCIETLTWASKGDAPKFSDLSALLSHFGYEPSGFLKNLARVLFAFVFLGLGFVAVFRLKRIEAAWMIGALSADYLMLFNPRTETCSFVALGPFVACLALLCLWRWGQPRLGWLLCLMALGLACDAIPKLGTFSLHDMTDRWFKPLLALLFFFILLRQLFARREPPIALHPLR